MSKHDKATGLSNKAKDATCCKNCDFYDDGSCEILHAREIPAGDCAGLLARDGVRQPNE